MARLFGTDGIRGIANIELTPELVYSIGFAHGYELRRQGCERPRVVVGRDTRISGELLESSYAAGLCAAGADVLLLGVIPTPAVAWYILRNRAQGGGVISASHNPVKDNGIKLLGPQGFKLRDEEEDTLEVLAKQASLLERPSEGGVGRLYHCEQEAEDAYVEYLLSLAQHRLEGMRFVIDCANGASSRVAPRVFRGLGAEVTVLHAEPDGMNINLNCGSTHMESLQQKVVEEKAQFGLAFDGDADRCLACDEYGHLVDGDPLLLIFARYLREQGRLPGDCVVTTVMANLGLEEALKAEHMTMARTNVGDRYVLAKMLECGGKLGGEQSGHIIFLDHATTGDGVLTGLMLTQILAEKSRSLADLAADCHKKPQLLVNVRVKDKHHWREFEEVEAAVKHVEDTLAGRGRLLVRPSGTENLLRLMAEGPDSEELQGLLQGLKEALERCCPPEDGATASSGDDGARFASFAARTAEMAERLRRLSLGVGRLAEVGCLEKISSCAHEMNDLANHVGVWAHDCRQSASAWELYANRERKMRQLEFGVALRNAAQAAGMEFGVITANPPEYRLGRFTLTPDFPGGVVELNFCRMPVVKVGLQADRIIDAAQDCERTLERDDFKAEQYFSDILVAYKRRLILEGKPLGKRVNLVDLVPELAFLGTLASGKARKGDRPRREYDRVQFAWDFMRMWRGLHGLELNGRRLNLGTATINATKNKRSVLFLEEGGTHGQYYLSIWFTKKAE